MHCSTAKRNKQLIAELVTLRVPGREKGASISIDPLVNTREADPFLATCRETKVPHFKSRDFAQTATAFCIAAL